jgi:hypothetical protein
LAEERSVVPKAVLEEPMTMAEEAEVNEAPRPVDVEEPVATPDALREVPESS